ncbi:MAG: HAD-IC family P-type ATPase [Kosmotogaceae bacterium]
MEKAENSTEWYKLSVKETLKRLKTSKDGLNDEEYQSKKKKFGPNELPSKKPVSLRKVIFHQFKDPLIYILLAAAIVSIVIGGTDDAIFIMIVVLLNAVIGSVQEYKAEKSAEALLKIMKTESRIIRNGKTITVNSKEIVPGDIVLLQSGDKVPADLRLMESNSLKVDESFLTGESTAIDKDLEQIQEDVELGDRKNQTFAGSVVMTGRGKGIVVDTGQDTELGKIAKVVSESEKGKAPLIIRMERFTKRIAYLVLIAAVVFAFIRFFQGYEIMDVFFLAVALSVSAIPEGLPVALTVALSVATSRMAKRKVIVRKLEAVESLGSCTVIASDKTGTLTVNQQTARKIRLSSGRDFEVTGEGYNGEGRIIDADIENDKELGELIKIASIANEGSLEKNDDTWSKSGDAMEVALLGMIYKAGINPVKLKEETEILQEIPYESQRRFSAASYESSGKHMIAVKGALETILGMCSHTYDPDRDFDRNAIEKEALELTEKGYRVLAFAQGELHPSENIEHELRDLHFIGIVGFIDPLRSEVKGAVRECHEAGVKVIMITGDHPSTAKAIAVQLGIVDQNDDIVTGTDLDKAGDLEGERFRELVNSTNVFARVSPVQKLNIVEALKNSGHYVAVTGDGVNDAPALQIANIGVAMGSGTDVAKDTGSIIITDDNFASIVSGIEEGRFAYSNVRKVIYLLISTGAAELLLFVLAVVFNVPLPLVAVQILWLNLVTNGIQDVALAFEKGEPGVLKEPPRKPEHSIFDNLMIKETLVSGFTMGAIAFTSWMYMLFQDVETNLARNYLLLLFVLMQNIHILNCRSEKSSAFAVPLSRNYFLVLGVLGAHGIHLLAMNVPLLQNLLELEPVSLKQWLTLLVLAVPVLLVMELFKLLRKKNT